MHVIERLALRPLPVLLALLLLHSAAAPARAQQATHNGDAWRVTVTPYLWLPAVQSNLGVEDLPFEVEADSGASDLFDKLDFAVLLCGEVRKGKVGLLYDLQFLKMSDDGVVGPLDGRTYDAELTIADATLALQYRVVDMPDFSLDGFGGARVTYADTSIDISAGLVLPATGGGQDKTWVDPIVGLKCRWQFADRWSVLGYGDIGGFGAGSELTYQLMGVVAYHFNDRLALQAGYRYFAVDYDRGGFELDAQMHGPVIGVTFAF